MDPKDVNIFELSKKSEEDIETVLNENAELKRRKDTNDRSLLHWGALHGRIHLVELLLNDSSYPIDDADDTGATPLILATLGGHLDIIKLLIDKSANIDHRNKQGHSALQYACSKERINIVQYLLEKGADINITDHLNDTPLHRLASKGSIDILKILLNNPTKLNIDLQNKSGCSALHIACEDDQTVFALALIDAGASVTLVNKEKETPLDVSKPALRKQIKTKLGIQD